MTSPRTRTSGESRLLRRVPPVGRERAGAAGRAHPSPCPAHILTLADDPRRQVPRRSSVRPGSGGSGSVTTAWSTRSTTLSCSSSWSGSRTAATSTGDAEPVTVALTADREAQDTGEAPTRRRRRRRRRYDADPSRRRQQVHIGQRGLVARSQVDELRATPGRGWLPYLAPMYGGVHARVLSVFQDPGPMTEDGSGSGMLCCENDDPSPSCTRPCSPRQASPTRNSCRGTRTPGSCIGSSAGSGPRILTQRRNRCGG